MLLSVIFVLFVISILGYRFVKSTPMFLTPTPTPSSAPSMDIVTQGEPGLSRDEYVAKAKETLAGKLNITVSEINLVSIEEVRFGDTSLGCPQSGRFYSQVITPGYKIVLLTQNNNYTYNAGVNKVINCESR